MRRFFWFSTWAIGLYGMQVRRRLLQSDTDALERVFPGDVLIEGPTLQVSRSITIQASPEQIWPWLAQMGRQRSGYYGIDRLDNWNIPSVAYLRKDISALQVGMTMDDGLCVLNFVEHEYLLCGSFNTPNDLGGRSDFVYLYFLEAQNSETTTLTIRTRIRSDGVQGWVFDRIYEVMDYWMIRARLEGIQQRTEHHKPEIIAVESVTTMTPDS